MCIRQTSGTVSRTYMERESSPDRLPAPMVQGGGSEWHSALVRRGNMRMAVVTDGPQRALGASLQVKCSAN